MCYEIRYGKNDDTSERKTLFHNDGQVLQKKVMMGLYSATSILETAWMLWI